MQRFIKSWKRQIEVLDIICLSDRGRGGGGGGWRLDSRAVMQCLRHLCNIVLRTGDVDEVYDFDDPSAPDYTPV